MISALEQFSIDTECEKRVAQSPIYFYDEGYSELLETTKGRNCSSIDFQPGVHIANKPALPMRLLFGNPTGWYDSGICSVVLGNPSRMNRALVHETQHAFDDVNGNLDALTPPYFYSAIKALLLTRPLYLSLVAQTVADTVSKYDTSHWAVTNLLAGTVVSAGGIRYLTAPVEVKARSAEKNIKTKVFFSRQDAPRNSINIRELITQQ